MASGKVVSENSHCGKGERPTTSGNIPATMTILSSANGEMSERNGRTYTSKQRERVVSHR